jgi:hypothetical protein
MKCEYKDGYEVEYSGTLLISKGDDVGIYVKEDFIPADARSALDAAASHNSCSELRAAAHQLTDTINYEWSNE